MAVRAEESGVKRASTDPLTLLVLSVLAGAFISFGAIFATTVSAGSIAITAPDGAAAFSAGLPYGVMRLLTGLRVLLGPDPGRRRRRRAVHRQQPDRDGLGERQGDDTRRCCCNWVIAFVGNFVGAIATAGLMFYTTQYTFGGGSVGLAALSTANAKASLAFVPALTLGIMCNALVCLAVWMCYSARTTIDRVVTIVPPITAFVAAGFEHSIANIYFIPMGLFIKAGAPDSFWASIGKTRGGFSGTDVGQFPRRQSAPGDDRQHHRRLGHGRRRLLVRLSAKKASLKDRHLRRRRWVCRPGCFD